MREQEPKREVIGRGELFFLVHPGSEDIFSGYGLTIYQGRKDLLVGLLMVDRPQPVAPSWLAKVEETFGEARLVAMAATGERGLLCQLQIEPESLPYLQQFPDTKSAAIAQALIPLLEEPPRPVFSLCWNESIGAWQSELASAELPQALREVFERTGYGCLAAETNIGVVHVCHASDADIEGFANKPVWSQWQLIEMPTAPLIRLELVVVDQPETPFKFESFLNICAQDQADVLEQLAGQGTLYLAFHGDDLGHRFTKVIEHEPKQRSQLAWLFARARRYWQSLPPGRRDFDLAKAQFMRRFI
jgi:hypothetical protein